MPDNDVSKPAENTEAGSPKRVNGGRNLIILGIAAIIIAISTTGFSLWIYRQNDIYLDRSRPGFISEGEKNEEESIETFSEEGEITRSVLDKYLEELDYVSEKIDGLSEAFSSGPLDDSNFLFDEGDDLDPEDAS